VTTNQNDPPQYYGNHVFVCTNRRPDDHPRGCCAAGGSEVLRDYLKQKVRTAGLTKLRVNNAGCLDRCELGPVLVIYPEGIWYFYENEQDLDEIVDRHLSKGERVERLLLAPDQRRREKHADPV
jgi:(2Fe-2S) ferredoxin